MTGDSTKRSHPRGQPWVLVPISPATPRYLQFFPVGCAVALHSRAMRIATFIAYSLLVLGAIGGLVANFFSLPKGMHLGIFCVGAGLLIGALESLITRRMSLRAWDQAAAAYDGVPAVVWGVMLAIVAGCFIGAAYAMNAGRWNAVTAYLVQQPAPRFALTGLLLLGAGVLAFVNPHGSTGEQPWWKVLLFRLPRVLFAALATSLALIVLACAAWAWLDVRDFQKGSAVILSIVESAVPEGRMRVLIRNIR